jgi:NitT/TauT family transport system substrate-binding protein
VESWWRTAARAWPVLVLIAALALSACGGDDGDGDAAGGGDGERQMTTLDVGILGIAADAPIWAAMERGYLAEEGLRIRTHIGAGGAALVPAVVSGDYDIGTGDLLSVITAASKGLRVKILTRDGVPISHATAASSVEDREHLGNGVVSADRSIRDASDLRGKTVAVATVGSFNTVMLSAWLDEHGVDPDSVRFLEVPFPEMPLAVERGRVDAAFVIEPFLIQITEGGGHVVGWPLAEVAPRLAFAGFFVNEEYGRESADVIDRFGRAVERANRFVDENEGAYRKLVGENTRTPPDVLQKMALRSFAPGREDSLEILIRLATRYGLVEDPPALEDLRVEVGGA